jgi:glucans biosynthesis protein
VDITTTDANADNVTAFWRPKTPLKAGATIKLAYRLTWGQNGPHEPSAPRVIDSRRSGPGGRHIEIEYRSANGRPLDPAGLQSEISTSVGQIAAATIKRAPGGGDSGVVLGFDLDAGDAKGADLRAVLTHQGRLASETWLYRWTR